MSVTEVKVTGRFSVLSEVRHVRLSKPEVRACVVSLPADWSLMSQEEITQFIRTNAIQSYWTYFVERLMRDRVLRQRVGKTRWKVHCHELNYKQPKPHAQLRDPGDERGAQ